MILTECNESTIDGLMEHLFSMEDLLLRNAIRSKKKDFVRGRNICEVFLLISLLLLLLLLIFIALRSHSQLRERYACGGRTSCVRGEKERMMCRLINEEREEIRQVVEKLKAGNSNLSIYLS